MNTTDIDRNWNHLYPEFRKRLKSLITEAGDKALELKMLEGYRSSERQRVLYAMGRPSEPGYQPGSIVTYSRIPTWHGAGLAADCYPVIEGKLTYTFSHAQTELYQKLMTEYGLRSSGMQGDYGHTQLNTEEPTRIKALHWVQNGFKDIEILVNGTTIPDTDTELDAENHISARIRPVMNSLNVSLIYVTAAEAIVRRNGENYSFRIVNRGGYGTFDIKELNQFPGVEVRWDNASKRVIVHSTAV